MRHRLLASLMLVPLALPLTAMAGRPSMGVIASAPRVAASSGVTPARVIHNDGIHIPSYVVLGEIPKNKRMVRLTLKVDENGYVRDVHINSPGSLLDTSVLQAVNGFRFKPARLDHHNIATTVHMTVRVRS